MIQSGAWKAAQDSVRDVLKRLAERGLQSDDLLPSNNSLIPLFVFHSKWSPHPGYRFERAYRWFLLANRDGRYGGSALTALNEDIRDLTGAADPDEALDKLYRRLTVQDKVELEEFLARYDRAGNRFLRLMVYLTEFEAGAVDWVDRTRIGYDKTGSAITGGFAPQWHHIYPKKILSDAEVDQDAVNALANITVLNEATNVRRLQAKTPGGYIEEFAISNDSLAGHLIPTGFAESGDKAADWHVQRYPEFLQQRAEALAAAASEYLTKLAGQEPESSRFGGDLSNQFPSAGPDEVPEIEADTQVETPNPIGNRWEIPNDDWDRVREQVLGAIRSTARDRELVSYTRLVDRVGHFSGPDSHALAEMLGEINAMEPPFEGTPLLISAVVTHNDDNHPGVGFFTAAEHLGLTVPRRDEDQRVFWANELERVHRAYGRGGDR
jgi:hypothetical protein